MTWMLISRRRGPSSSAKMTDWNISVRAVLARVNDVLQTFTVVLSPRDTAASPGQAQHGSCHKGSACKVLICGFVARRRRSGGTESDGQTDGRAAKLTRSPSPGPGERCRPCVPLRCYPLPRSTQSKDRTWTRYDAAGSTGALK